MVCRSSIRCRTWSIRGMARADLSEIEPPMVAKLHAELKSWQEQVEAGPMRAIPEYQRGNR